MTVKEKEKNSKLYNEVAEESLVSLVFDLNYKS